ncbi:MAG: hypothetical protein IKE16_12000 [Solobacterium sp.]|nr:hypothetical protein [Solobacterium sp.]
MSVYDYILRLILEHRLSDLLELPLAAVLCLIFFLSSFIGRWLLFRKAGKKTMAGRNPLPFAVSAV